VRVGEIHLKAFRQTLEPSPLADTAAVFGISSFSPSRLPDHFRADFFLAQKRMRTDGPDHSFRKPFPLIGEEVKHASRAHRLEIRTVWVQQLSGNERLPYEIFRFVVTGAEARNCLSDEFTECVVQFRNRSRIVSI